MMLKQMMMAAADTESTSAESQSKLARDVNTKRTQAGKHKKHVLA